MFNKRSSVPNQVVRVRVQYRSEISIKSSRVESRSQARWVSNQNLISYLVLKCAESCLGQYHKRLGNLFTHTSVAHIDSIIMIPPRPEQEYEKGMLFIWFAIRVMQDAQQNLCSRYSRIQISMNPSYVDCSYPAYHSNLNALEFFIAHLVKWHITASRTIAVL
jgi:hypothetical protein